MRRFFALIAAIAMLAVALPQQALAHPADPTQGGAGGRIIRVTTLAADGPGSLRAAIRAKGPRIIVFEVGGAVRDALMNPARERIRLVLTKNAADKLYDAIMASGMEPEIVDPRKFDAAVEIDAILEIAL